MQPYTYAPDFYTDFYYDADAFALWFEQTWPTLIPVALAAVAVFTILAIIFYVFGSLSIYTMAERRGFSASFVAWIPFVRWAVLGHVASDVHRARTGRRAFYGTVLFLLMLCSAGLGLFGMLSFEPQTWALVAASVLSSIQGILMLFALSEVYRDYSRCWVGMLIFTCLMPWLRSILLLAVHKNVPVSVRMKHAQAPEAVEVPVCEPVAAEPETVPTEPEALMQEIEDVPSFEETEEVPVSEPAAEEAEEEFEAAGV